MTPLPLSCFPCVFWLMFRNFTFVSFDDIFVKSDRKQTKSGWDPAIFLTSFRHYFPTDTYQNPFEFKFKSKFQQCITMTVIGITATGTIRDPTLSIHHREFPICTLMFTMVDPLEVSFLFILPWILTSDVFFKIWDLTSYRYGHRKDVWSWTVPAHRPQVQMSLQQNACQGETTGTRNRSLLDFSLSLVNCWS